MARTKKPAEAILETIQETQAPSEASQDAQELAMALDSPTDDPVGLSAQEIIGPEDPADLLGCQDEAELREGLLVEYAVTAQNGLRLRQEPCLDAPVLAVLPQGVGVYADAETGAEGGWLHVRTGRLSGWVMVRFLEPVPLPELGNGAD